jgi:hypothetical protein
LEHRVEALDRRARLRVVVPAEFRLVRRERAVVRAAVADQRRVVRKVDERLRAVRLAHDGMDAARAVGSSSKRSAAMLTRIAQRALISITRVRKGLPTFVALNREHAVAKSLESYLAAVATLWEPRQVPIRDVPLSPEFLPAEMLHGKRLFGHHARTEILVYVAVLGEVRARRLRENLGLTQWQSREVLRMWQLRGFVASRRVTPRPPGTYDYAYSLSLGFPAYRELRALLLRIAEVYFPRFAAQYRPANLRAERGIRHSYQTRAKLITGKLR